ncbi:MAG: VWA domain-containing protein [Bacteroidota bacterium]
MVFAHPLFLLLLLAVPALAWWEWRRARRRPASLSFSDTSAAETVAPTVWVRLRGLPAVLRLGALTLGILALARPQIRDTVVERSAEGIDIIMVLDLSTSMKAEDFRPNRFEAAKDVAARFVDGRTSDRIGLIVFAAQAYTQAPLTLDYDFLKEMLRSVQMGLIEDGTAIGTALATATARLRDSEAESKVIILLTDGQNNRGEVDPATAADVAEAIGVKVYAIGVGSEGRDAFGRRLPDRMRQLLPQSAQIDEAMLTTVAEKTGGRYFRATDREALAAIYDEISELETTEVQETSYLDVDERYALFLWPAFGLLLLEVLLSTTRLRRVP